MQEHLSGKFVATAVIVEVGRTRAIPTVMVVGTARQASTESCIVVVKG